MTGPDILDGVTFVCGTLKQYIANADVYCWYSFITQSILTQYCVQHGNGNSKSLVSLQTHNLRPKYWVKIVSTLTRKNTVLHRFHTMYSLVCEHECTKFMR